MIARAEYQRRYDLIAHHHLTHYHEHGVNPWMSQEPQLREWTVQTVRGWVPAGAAVLDAGSGIGLMLHDLAETFYATGVELAPEYVEYAQSLGLDARVGNIEQLPFPADSFQAAVCCDTLEHVQNPDRVIQELRRVITPGGVLVVRVPDGDATGVGADSGFGFPVHLHQWDRDELVAVVGGTLLGTETWQQELIVGARL